jgi:hypothetical protein
MGCSSAANGEISSTPAGGRAVSVAVAAPAGRPVAVAVATDANVTTIRPFSRKAAVEVIVGTVAFRNSSAAVNAPGVSGAHDAPAEPSGQGGCTIVSRSCGPPPASSAASFANAPASRPDQPLSSVPAGTAWVSMYGAAEALALAWSKEVPESSISQTCVTGARVLALDVLFGVVEAGVVASGPVSEAGVAAVALAASCSAECLAWWRRLRRGAASAVIAGGAAAAGAL